ncbi:MAG: tetratricopeptide repeat protein [Gemmatimonadota bacterium]
MLGNPSIEGPDGILSGAVAQRHRLALLAVLAGAPRGILAREKLIGLLWPESGTAQARNLLNAAVHVLRRSLGEDVLLGEGEALRLDSRALRIDVLEMQEAVASGNAARTVELYRGSFLDGFSIPNAVEFEQWQERERERLERLYHGALEHLAQAAWDGGDHQNAVQWWRRRLACSPAEGRVAAHLMRALVEAGDRAGALHVASLHSALLDREFNAAPDAEVIALADALRRSTSARRRSPEETEPFGNADRNHQEHTTAVAAPIAPRFDSPKQRHSLPGRLRTRIALLGLVVAAIAVFVPVRWLLKADSAPVRVAVLPLRNIAPDTLQDHLAEGMTEALGAEFAKIPSMQVIYGVSTRAYKNTQKSPSVIAKELGGVDALLDGTMFLSADRARLTIRVISPADNRILWADEHDEDVRDILTLYTNVAKAVAGSLSIALTNEDQARLARTQRVNADAYNAYLRGMYYRKRWQDGGCVTAEKFFESAIALDSSFALPRAELAMCNGFAAMTGRNGLVNREKALPAVTRALEIDDRLAVAYVALGTIRHRLDHDWTLAETAYRKAFQLDRNNADVDIYYGEYLLTAGKTDRGLEFIERSIERDPFNLDYNVGLAHAYYQSGRYRDAIHQLQETLKLDANWVLARRNLARSYEADENREQAVREYLTYLRQVIVSPRAEIMTSALADEHARAGWHSFWVKDLELCEEERLRPGSVFKSVHVQNCGPWSMAERHARLGNRDRAMEFLEAAYAQRHHMMVFIKSEPLLASLRNHLPFKDLIRRVRIP